MNIELISQNEILKFLKNKIKEIIKQEKGTGLKIRDLILMIIKLWVDEEPKMTNNVSPE